MHRLHLAALLPWIVCVGLAAPVTAQETPPIQMFQEGIEALEAGELETAAARLGSVVAAESGFYSPARGSAAYWWGNVLARLGDEERAHRAWSAGLGALEQRGLIDARLSDAYIQSVYTQRRPAEYHRAAEAYLNLMEEATQFADAEQECIAIRHIAQVLPLLSRADANRVAERTHPEKCNEWRLRNGAGEFLGAWWRARDPLLASDRNERLEVHLERVAYALRHLASDRRVSAIDARGEVFVRFGAPERKRILSSSDNPLSRRDDVAADLDDWSAGRTAAERSDARTSGSRGSSALNDNPLVVLPAGMPRGELWIYDHIHQSGYYVFVREGRDFRLGQLTDMVPTSLRSTVGFRGPRNTGLAANLLYGSRMGLGLYEQLYYEHPDFASAITRFENAQARNAAGTGDYRTLWLELRADEEAAVAERERRMPADYADLPINAGSLRVDHRSARFLDDDGTTRTEIYWQLAPIRRGDRASRVANERRPRKSLLEVTVAQRQHDYRARSTETRAYLYESERGEGLADRAHTTVVRGDTGLYHVAMQWQLHAVQFDGSDSLADAVSVHQREASVRIDSLRSLTSRPGVLEMSDLVPISAEDLLRSGVDSRTFRPLPFFSISQQDSVALYFEVYHLHPGDDGRANYVVEYEVARRRTSGVLGLARGGETLTTASTSYSALGRSSSNAIALDLDDRVSGLVDVTVRIRDGANGQETERSISFEFR